MSTTARLQGTWQGWLNFWFAPVDPTTLGFIRLVTGFAVLYVHIAYCFDLRAFFGPEGWYGLQYVNRERWEAPTQIGAFWGPEAWQESFKGARVPEYPHRRAAVMAYIRSLPTERRDLEPRLAFIDRINQTRDTVAASAALAYVELLSGDPEIRATQLKEMIELTPPGQRTVSAPPVPDYFVTLPKTGDNSRTKVAEEIEAFFKSLPTDTEDRRFVITHLLELDRNSREAFLQFLRDLTTVSAEERADRLNYLEYWNTEKRYAYRVGNPIFSLWFHISEPTEMAIAHGVILVIMFLFAIGFCTRVTSVLTWLAAISYIHRNQQVLFGMDTMMNILLIYLMIGNSGAALSVDRLIARYRAAKNSLRRSGGIDAVTRQFLEKPPASVSAGFALRLLQVHFCFIYMAAGLSKLKGAAWWNTNAYWDTLANPEFTLIHYHWYEWLVRQMVQERPVYAIAAALAVAFTFIAEIGLPFLVWTRLRPYIVIMGFLLHAGVAIFMGLWIFSLLMMTMLLGYIPGCCIRERLFGTKSDEKVTVRLDHKSEPQLHAAALAQAVDFDDQIDWQPGNHMEVLVQGQPVPRDSAAKELLQRLSWTRSWSWLVSVPLLGGLIERQFLPREARPLTLELPTPNLPGSR